MIIISQILHDLHGILFMFSLVGTPKDQQGKQFVLTGFSN